MKALRMCPICNTDVVEKIYTLNYSMPAEYKLSRTIEVVCCSNCGMVYDDLSAVLDDCEEYSKENNRYEDYEMDYIKRYLSEIGDDFSKRFSPRDISILDIGCSTGILLDILKNKGFVNICGLDPSKISCEKVVQRNINARQGSIYEKMIDFEDNFDVIILVQVLEHLYDVDKAIIQMKKWLKDDGYIYISVPDAASYQDYYGNISSVLCAEHINHFSEISLNRVMEKHGFKQRTFFKRSFKVSEKSNTHGDDIVSSFDGIYSVVNKSELSQDIDKDIKSAKSVKSLIEEYETRNANKEKKIKKLLESGEQLILWGATHMAMNLLDTTLKNCNIEAFVDIDCSKQGLVIKGIPVKSPEILYEFDGSILILESIVMSDILNSIKKMGLTHNVVIL